MDLKSFYIFIKIGDITYKISRIGFDNNKEELFYHFLSIHKRNILSSIGEDNKKYSYSIPDHISFHGNGTVHIKYKKKKNDNKRDIVKQGKYNIFHPKDNDMVQSILMHTLYFDKKDYPIATKDELNRGVCWEIKLKKLFSIILFIKHNSINPDLFMKTYDFYNKLKILKKCFYFNVANNFQLLLFLSACKNRSNEQLYIPKKELFMTFAVFPNMLTDVE